MPFRREPRLFFASRRGAILFYRKSFDGIFHLFAVVAQGVTSVANGSYFPIDQCLLADDVFSGRCSQ